MTPPARRRRFEHLPPFPGLETIIRVYHLPPPAIQYLTALTEAADGVGLVRTLDEERGIVECWVMPDFEHEFDQILAATAAQWPLQPLDDTRE
ncbi:MAG TPA: DUF4911 domain-containing protein [Candidatus Sumerlaeota bacterium]|nr:DUF4911 domain-containing protein [Candidatus Sumerlaeota bacterium]HPK02340.1 DUF4911 domain-containing protein [Candidatus Sumerlaeota bacterium]